ncbi:hypothetical protein ACFUAC_19310 [Streptomyces sp. NPDC057148]|uniref:hypothetical protein n=1 Tax=unclassified Streptomyces TaxID=2593676 RepID=UPI00362737D7
MTATLAGDATFEAADAFAFRHAFFCASFETETCTGVSAKTGHDDAAEGGVGLQECLAQHGIDSDEHGLEPAFRLCAALTADSFADRSTRMSATYAAGRFRLSSHVER